VQPTPTPDPGQKEQRGLARRILGALLASSERRSRSVAVEPARVGRGESDYAALKTLIKARGLLERRPGHYAVPMALVASLLVAGVAWVAWARGGPLVFLGAPLLAFVSGQLVLLGHEAAHRAIFASRRANDALALVAINLLNGGCHTWWAASHNEHHARSNDLELDPDADYPFLAFSEAQLLLKDPAFYPILARQHWLLPLLMPFVAVTLRLYSLVHLATRGVRRLEIAAAATFYVAYPALLVAALGPLRALAFAAVHQALFGVYVASVTSVNHWGMPMPDGAARLDFLRQQVTTSRNVAGGWLADLWFAGLNRQIEHHLFPAMARPRLREARPIVRAFCAARGIPFHEVGLVRGYLEMFTAMRRVARTVPDLRARASLPPTPRHRGTNAC
jgi:fatty acid desaturase